MRAWILGAVAMWSAGAWACESPECAVQTYIDAHLAKDAEQVYQLTATSGRGDFAEFAADYHERHWAPSSLVEFVQGRTRVDVELLSEGAEFARVSAIAMSPNYHEPAMDRALDGHGLDTSEDWSRLVDHMQEHGVETVREEFEFYLIRDDGAWRILRPLLH